MAPQAAFLQIRLSLAHHLIATTDKTVAQVAVDCGFCDSSHLSRVFRRSFGITPNAVRRDGEGIAAGDARPQ